MQKRTNPLELKVDNTARREAAPAPAAEPKTVDPVAAIVEPTKVETTAPQAAPAAKPVEKKAAEPVEEKKPIAKRPTVKPLAPRVEPEPAVEPAVEKELEVKAAPIAPGAMRWERVSAYKPAPAVEPTVQTVEPEPIEIEDAYVKCVSDGIYVNKSPMGLGATHHMGTSVCLEVGNVSIAVGTNRFQTMDDGPFYSVGIDWKSKHILAMKSAQHFKGWWADKVKAIYSCDSPGIHCSDLSLVPFSQADTSYFPLQDAKWDGE